MNTSSVESRTPGHIFPRASTSLEVTGPAVTAATTLASSSICAASLGACPASLDAHEAFLRSRRDQASIPRKDACLRKAPGARSARTFHGIQQPVIHTQWPMEPDGVIQTGQDQPALKFRGPVRQHGGPQQEKVGRVCQQVAMQPLIIRQLTESLEPDLPRQLRAPVGTLGMYDPEHKRPRLGNKLPQPFWQMSPDFRRQAGLIGEAFRRENRWHLNLVVEPLFQYQKGNHQEEKLLAVLNGYDPPVGK